jgi:hypothetical protein
VVLQKTVGGPEIKSLQAIALSVLLGVGAVGLIATSAADFNAQTDNASTFASGTLVLSDARTGGTTCLSTGGATTDTNSNGTGCDDLIAATIQKPGGAATTRVVTVRNVGSLAASSFHLFANTACVSSNAIPETYHGTGDICTAIALTIHDDTNNWCYYPTNATGACTIAGASTLATFSTAYPSDTTPLVLSTTALSGGIAFTIGTQLVSTATNPMQGRAASINLGWKIAQ